ncbi:MAG: hypothetical protein AAF362_06135 [Pseudomonadota bacterium]
MPLKNRVAPDGTLHAVSDRGMFTGNRGVIHDPVTRTGNGKRWTTHSWITCTCEWKGRRRDVWGYQNGPGRAGWSELFFLDEVTALAAGHRPCFFCRRKNANAFSAGFANGNKDCDGRAPSMDRILHRERRLSAKVAPKSIDADEILQLPDGTMLEREGTFFAFKAGTLLPWRFSGYEQALELRALIEKTSDERFFVVTPKSTIAALEAGYVPVWHDSAKS